MKAPMKGIVVLAAAPLLVACGVHVNSASQDEDRAYDVGGQITTVRVHTDADRIEVVGADAGPVRVREHLTYSADSRRPRPEHPVAGGVLTLRYTCPRGVVLGTNTCGVAYQVTVPRGTGVEIRTDSGAVRLTGLAGEVKAESDSGAIDAGDLRGGRLTVRSDSGGVRLDGTAATDVDVRTDSGTVTATGLRSRRLNARSDSGDLRLDWVTVPEQVTGSTESGAIRLGLPKERYAVAATSDSGDKQIGVVQDPASTHRITVRSDSGGIALSQT